LPAPLAGIRFRERNGTWRSETEHRQYIGLDYRPEAAELEVDEKRKEATFSEKLTAILFPRRAVSKGAAEETALLFKARRLVAESQTSLPVQLTALLFPRRGLRLGALDDETLMGELRRRLRHSEINRKGSQ